VASVELRETGGGWETTDGKGNKKQIFLRREGFIFLESYPTPLLNRKARSMGDEKAGGSHLEIIRRRRCRRKGGNAQFNGVSLLAVRIGGLVEPLKTQRVKE